MHAKTCVYFFCHISNEIVNWCWALWIGAEHQLAQDEEYAGFLDVFISIRNISKCPLICVWYFDGYWSCVIYRVYKYLNVYYAYSMLT